MFSTSNIQFKIIVNSFVQIITTVEPKQLKLSLQDDLIYEEFRKKFKDFDISNIKEDNLKSDTAKRVSYLKIRSLKK